MAANPTREAGKLYRWACGNPKRIAAIRDAFDAAMEGGALTKGGTDSVTSASKNGVSYQKVIGLTEPQRSDTLDLALTYLEAGIRPSSRTIGRFF
jgi:hypothetical protein